MATRRAPSCARAALVAVCTLLGCANVSGLEDFEFRDAPGCKGEGKAVLCAGKACGSVTDRCGATVDCDDTCGPLLLCGGGGVVANTRGCAGAPPPIAGCELHDEVDSTAGTASRYYLCDELLTWDEAQARCTELGTQLAIVTTIEERDRILQFLDGRKALVGLSDKQVEGTFAWVDGTPFPADQLGAYFAPGEPNNADSAEDCVEMNGDTGLWNDIPCAADANRTRFLCETVCGPPA